MKDNYSEMNVDMEQILFSKEYEELTAAEMEDIKDFISSREDFYIMKNTLMNVKNSFGIEEEIEPVHSSKEDLMKMFDQKYGKVVPMQKTRPFYLHPAFQIGIAALFILGIIYFYPQNENKNQTAMVEENEKESQNKEESEPEETKAPAEDDKLLSENETEETASTADETVSDVPEKDVKSSVADKNLNSSGTTTVSSFSEGLASVKKAEAMDTAYFKTDINRISSTKNEKDRTELANAKADDADGSFNFAKTENTEPTTSTTVTGGAVTGDWTFATAKEEEKADAEKKKDGRVSHTNNAGGHYHQPAMPSADIKGGISLKDKPELADFLFTAL